MAVDRDADPARLRHRLAAVAAVAGLDRVVRAVADLGQVVAVADPVAAGLDRLLVVAVVAVLAFSGPVPDYISYPDHRERGATLLCRHQSLDQAGSCENEHCLDCSK